MEIFRFEENYCNKINRTYAYAASISFTPFPRTWVFLVIKKGKPCMAAPKMANSEGVEPSTLGLRIPCSTI